MGLGKRPARALLCSFFAIAALSASADDAKSVIELSGTPKKISGVSVAPDAKITLDGATSAVKLSGAGVRRVVFPLYVAASYVEDLTTLRRAKTKLEGVNAQKARVIRLTMLMPLKADKVRASFTSALRLNDVDVESEPFKSVLAGWDKDLKTRDSATIVAVEKQDGTQVLVFELPGKSMRFEGKKLADQMWTVWFGRGDSDLEALGELLVGKE